MSLVGLGLILLLVGVVLFALTTLNGVGYLLVVVGLIVLVVGAVTGRRTDL